MIKEITFSYGQPSLFSWYWIFFEEKEVLSQTRPCGQIFQQAAAWPFLMIEVLFSAAWINAGSLEMSIRIFADPNLFQAGGMRSCWIRSSSACSWTAWPCSSRYWNLFPRLLLVYPISSADTWTSLGIPYWNVHWCKPQSFYKVSLLMCIEMILLCKIRTSHYQLHQIHNNVRCCNKIFPIYLKNKMIWSQAWSNMLLIEIHSRRKTWAEKWACWFE